MFLLLLIGLGAVSVKAQVRIGGNAAPSAAAVLDLNANDDATPAANKGGLALPRVNLTDTLSLINGNTPLAGMLVYNTNATLGSGIYFWNGKRWVLANLPATASAEKGKILASDGFSWVADTAAIPRNFTVTLSSSWSGAPIVFTIPANVFGICVGHNLAWGLYANAAVTKNALTAWGLDWGGASAPAGTAFTFFCFTGKDWR